MDYKKDCKVSFGSYVQAIHETNTKNTTMPNTWCHTSTIIRYATRRIWNYVLLTGNITSRCKVTPIPITQEVIDRVEDLGKRDGI